MKKITLCSALLFFTFSAVAYQSYIIMSPDEPAKLVGGSFEIPQEMKDLAEERRRQIKEHGYVPMYSKNAELLMKFKDVKGTADSVPEDVPDFEILRLNTNDFQLTFPFDGFPSISKIDMIGFGPSLSYDSDSDKWTGLTAYFHNEKLGVCRFIVWDMPASEGQSVYDSNSVSFDINKKPTFTSVQGSPESGYFFEASWTGKRYEKMLECANDKPFERGTIKNLVLLAKKIDKDLPDPAK